MLCSHFAKFSWTVCDYVYRQFCTTTSYIASLCSNPRESLINIGDHGQHRFGPAFLTLVVYKHYLLELQVSTSPAVLHLNPPPVLTSTEVSTVSICEPSSGTCRTVCAGGTLRALDCSGQCLIQIQRMKIFKQSKFLPSNKRSGMRCNPRKL